MNVDQEEARGVHDPSLVLVDVADIVSTAGTAFTHV